MRIAWVGLLGLPLLVFSQGCNSNSASTEDEFSGVSGAGGAGGIVGKGGAPNGAGLGDACSDKEPCRPGLTCGVEGTCVFARSAALGSPCKASGECQPGAFCGLTHVCTPATGSAKEEEPCESDADCADGLRCGVQGFASVCQPEGKGDLGKPCSAPGDCVAGLGCLQGVCGQPPMGTTPLLGGSPGKTETCVTEEGPPIAWFRVPRGNHHGDFYRLPFPNDIRRKGGKPDLTGHITPGPGILGFDALQRYIEELQQRDGFSAFAPVYLRFNTPVDIDSLRKEGVVQYVDITEGTAEFGQELGLYWLMAGSRGTYICQNWMGIRAAPYSLPLPGHTYAVILRKGPLTGHEDPAKRMPIESDDDFKVMVKDETPTDSSLAQAHQAYAPLRGYLKKKEIDPASVLVASVYTVGAISEPAEKLAAAASAKAPPSSGWVRCGSGAPSPCPDTTGDRACGPEDPDYDELHALIELPIFQQGKAPYLTPEDGGGIDTSGATLSPVRTEPVCLSLTVPKATMPEKGWPVVVYAHGTGGNFRSHVTQGLARLLAKAESGEGVVPIAVLGIDQVQHGPRRGGSTKGPDILFYNFANPAAALGNPLQGAADQVALGAFVASFSLPASSSPTQAEIRFDPNALLFWGHSQGATAGGIGVPYSPHYRAVVFSGQGASLADALVSKTKPQNIAAALPFALQDPENSFPPKLYAGEFNPALALLQAYIDPADPANHARRLVVNPREGLSPRHVFQVYGLDDSFSPRATQQHFAMAAGLAQVTPEVSLSKPDDIWGQNTFPPPFSGNYAKEGTFYTAALRQYAPGSYDGHFVAFQNATASSDVVRFLAQAAQGKVPQVGAP
ncbi:MAG: dickkopf-related protein [Myxococcales bacterium]|nr:dickkopf-related protein [Polyangiaceae bacterium]MDW8250778.1 dickkopf-related protein [Myxococcales bacterium]